MSGDLAEALETLKGVTSASAAMELLKRGLRNCFIRGARPLSPVAGRMVGVAYTLRFIPMREDLSGPDVLSDRDYPPRKAIEEVPPGQILIVDARGETSAGVIGGILATRLQKRGAAGVVTDGAVRDASDLAALGLPIFCAGAAAPASLGAHFGADLQVPIACGGVAVLPGDVLLGDGDGVVVIPRALVSEIAADGIEREQREAFLQHRIEAGASTFGTYPPDQATLADYAQQRRKPK